MKSAGLLIVNLTWFLVFLVQFAQGAVKTYIVDNNSSQKEMKILVLPVLDEKEEFITVAKDGVEDVKALTYTTSFAIPAQLKVKSVSVTVISEEGAEEARVKLIDAKLVVSGYGLKQEVNLIHENGTSSKLIIERTFETPKVVYDNCTRAFPELVFDAATAVPFSVGMSCLVRPGKSKAIVVSIPSDASIGSSSFFDSMGKGERWRLYEIPDTVTDGGLIGNISVKFKDKLYKLNLVSINLDIANNLKLIEQLQKENKTLSEKINELLKVNKSLSGKRDNLSGESTLLEAMVSLFDVYFAMGNNSTKLNIEKSAYGPISKSDSEIAVQMYSISDPIFDHIIMSGGFTTTLPLGTKEDRIDFFEAQGSMGYLISIDKISIIPKLSGAYRSFAHQLSTMYVQAGQMGGGLTLGYAISENNNIKLDFASQSMGSKVIKAHSEFTLAYEHRFLSPKVWWLGAKFSSQNINAVNAAGDPRKIDNTQAMIYLSL